MAEAFQRAGVASSIFYSSFHHLLLNPGADGPVQVETNDGVEFVGIPCRSYEGNGLSRVLNMFDFPRLIKKWIKEESPEIPDVVFASSPHPWVIDVALYLKRKFGTKVVFEVRDLWPESLIELAGVSKWHPFVLLIERTVRKGLREADAVVSLLPATSENFEAKGMDPDKFHWIPNGVDVDRNRERLSCSVPDSIRCAIDSARDRGRFLIGYAGAMGPPNALDQVVALAEYWKNEEAPMEFLLVGRGGEQERLQQTLEKTGCDFIRFLESIDKSEVPSFLAEMDANIICWQDKPLYRFGVSPNKVSEYMLAGKPVIWIGNTANDPVREAGCGVSALPNQPGLLKKEILDLIETSPEARKEMGGNGYGYACEHLNWEVLGGRYTDIVRTLVDA